MHIFKYVLIVVINAEFSYQQNIHPEHRKRHCQALQTADIMEHVLPEIRRFLHDEIENIRRVEIADIVKQALPEIRQAIQEESEKNRVRCEQGWKYYDGNCYLFSSPKVSTWQGAKQICKNKNAYLVEIKSNDENSFIKKELTKLHAVVNVDISHQQNIHPAHKRRHCQALQTADMMEHVLPEIRRFLHEEIENIRRVEIADIVKQALPEIRQAIQEESEKNRVVTMLSCEPGWIYYDGYCYLFSQTKRTWNESIEECRHQGAYLADIQSDEETRFVKLELNKLHTNESQRFDYFIGGYLNRGWTWKHSGQKIRYTNWAPNEPNCYTKDEDCIMLLDVKDFKWNDTRCNDRYYAICKRRAERKEYSR